jgi:hypothetical protein
MRRFPGIEKPNFLWAGERFDPAYECVNPSVPSPSKTVKPLSIARGFQSRSARSGSVRVARLAGRKHAANEAMVITTNAVPYASGSRGLTL